MDLKVQSLKIVGNKVELTKVERDPADNSRLYPDYDSKALVHPDLTRALAKLRIHAAVLLRLVSPKQIKHIENEPDEKLVEHLHVYGVTYSGGDDRNEQVQILCRLTCLGGSPVSLALPPQRFEGPAENRYVFMAELLRTLALVNEECEAYADGSKRGADTGEKKERPKKEKTTHARVLPPQAGGGSPEPGLTSAGSRLPQADAAQQSELQGEWTPGEYQEKVDQAPAKKATTGGRRQPQTAANPRGDAQ